MKIICSHRITSFNFNMAHYLPFLVKLQGEAKFVLVIQKHPKLVTYKAQAYRIRCVYNTGEQNLNIGFNVSTLTTAGTIANTGPAPTCTMRICNSNGDDISQAEIGDQLMLKVEVKNYPYFVFLDALAFSGVIINHVFTFL